MSNLGAITSSGSRCKRDHKSSCHLNETRRANGTDRVSERDGTREGGTRDSSNTSKVDKRRRMIREINVPHAQSSLQTSHEGVGFGQHVQSGPHVQLSPAASENKRERE